jgi:hypothetical protein
MVLTAAPSWPQRQTSRRLSPVTGADRAAVVMGDYVRAWGAAPSDGQRAHRSIAMMMFVP